MSARLSRDGYTETLHPKPRTNRVVECAHCGAQLYPDERMWSMFEGVWYCNVIPCRNIRKEPTL